MSTRDDGGGMSSAPAAEEVSSDSDSRSSYVGSGEPGPSNCRWRTTRFHDQECSRYFDCPSHIVERALSHSEEDHEDEDEDEHQAQEQEQARHEQRERQEQGDGNMADRDEHRASPGTVSPVSEDNGIDGGPRLASRETVSPLPDAPATSDTGPLAGGDDDEIEITGSRTISREVEVVRPSARTRAASGTAENPIDLRDDSLPQTPSRNQPRYPGGGELPPLPHSAQQPGTVAEMEISPPRNARTRGLRPRPSPRSPDFVLPRWQPDAEVTYCPICRTQFSTWVRKHHCRKCGRVVCNRCSPHRITIPYQYIVRPPGTPRQGYPPYQDGSDLSFIGGGERVRLCNPCVPDPNIAPPQQAQATHSRSQSNLVVPTTANDTSPSSNRWSSYFGGTTANDLPARSRSVTMHAGPSGSSSSRAGPSSSTGWRPRLEPQPLAEEDECPVCHRELPSRTLQNFEALREAHITICITSHSTYSGSVPVTPDANTGGSEGLLLPPARPRLTGMFPYTATEKDCVDSAECTICLEEFEAGAAMARLECLCRFHRVCITAWWERHPGRCPVHQHDGFGY
ncbi:FYVE zinc finger domain containing protein [Naviculisporaceae sp. PSN 640]